MHPTLRGKDIRKASVYASNGDGRVAEAPHGECVLVEDDEKWRQILRGLQSTFRHQTISGAQVEGYIAKESGLNLTKVFDQYLRTTKIPELEYKLDGDRKSVV